MKKIYFIAGIAIILASIVLGMWSANRADTDLVAEENGAGEPGPIVLQPQMNEEGEVSVSVTPTIAGSWSFEIVMNTHSVALSEDPAEAAVLVDDQGNEYGPLRWEGDPSGGHHRQGVLFFEAIAPLPASITLTIVIGGTERNFNWILK